MSPIPPHHHNPEIFFNDEQERSLAEIGEILQQMGSFLNEKGNLKLDGVKVAPSDPCEFIIRYERAPKGELKFKLELSWWEMSSKNRTRRKRESLQIEPGD